MGISLGLVGLGSFGSSFAPLFKAHPLVDRVALCDREPERIAKFADDPFFADKFASADAHASLEDILQADLDALVIITQPWLHAPQAAAALEAGKNVYSAVPVLSVRMLRGPDAEDRLAETNPQPPTHRRDGLGRRGELRRADRHGLRLQLASEPGRHDRPRFRSRPG